MLDTFFPDENTKMGSGVELRPVLHCENGALVSCFDTNHNFDHLTILTLHVNPVPVVSNHVSTSWMFAGLGPVHMRQPTETKVRS